jgi:hypothetical protein
LKPVKNELAPGHCADGPVYAPPGIAKVRELAVYALPGIAKVGEFPVYSGTRKPGQAWDFVPHAARPGAVFKLPSGLI